MGANWSGYVRRRIGAVGRRSWCASLATRVPDPRFPQAGKRIYRLVTTLLDPFLYPAKDLVVLYHERWQGALVIDETRCDLRLAQQTLRSRTPQGVEQEWYALLLVHVLVRTMMLRAAEGE